MDNYFKKQELYYSSIEKLQKEVYGLQYVFSDARSLKEELNEDKDANALIAKLEYTVAEINKILRLKENK